MASPPTQQPAEVYGFPFPPYDIQVDFMDALHGALASKQVAVMESPTGTGKSLSIICGASRWITENMDSAEAVMPDNDESSTIANGVSLSFWLVYLAEADLGADDGDADGDEPAWVTEQASHLAHERRLGDAREHRQRLRERLERIRQREREQQHLSRKEMAIKKAKREAGAAEDSDAKEDDFLVADYHSDSDSDKASALRAKVAQVMQTLQELDDSTSTKKDDVEEDEPDALKVYYASRTHSQLSQFVHELRKTEYKDKMLVISLGSRRTLCINETVRRKAGDNVQRLNDLCLDLQKNKSKQKKDGGGCGCPYLSTDLQLAFRDHALAEVRDIEELVHVGKTLNACPYYGARKAVRSANLVTLPYNMLLDASARQSLGLSLRNNIVVLDEAHNIIETVETAKQQLEAYFARYKNRLKGQNVVYIKQLLNLLTAIHQFMKDSMRKRSSLLLMVSDFAHSLNIDHVNFFKIERYLERSQLTKKVLTGGEVSGGYFVLTGHSDEVSSHLSPLSQVEAFLTRLTHADADGRVLFIPPVTAARGEPCPYPQLKYVLLNPSVYFTDIVREARSVVLAGGTMQPMGDFDRYLFPSVPAKSVRHFSCGHVIASDQLMALTVSHGPTGQLLKYTLESRHDHGMLDELGRILVNVCNVVPGGVVVFVSSYAYLDILFARMQETGVLERLGKRKQVGIVLLGCCISRLTSRSQVFREPKGAGQVDETLRDYALVIEQCMATPDASQTGAVLFSVVGGKMSEGINFSDHLGRCVIVVGLPFANLGSVELTERMKFIEATEDKAVAQDYYENLCMRAVNQSIDYACVVLLDQRYEQSRIRSKLPGWIAGSLQSIQEREFGKAVGSIAQFFRSK
ncbi:ATP-dependent DNA helicase chl1 [Sorochytrium milnesiophthora]